MPRRRVPRESDSAHSGQAYATFIISEGIVQVRTGTTHTKIPSPTVRRCRVLSQALDQATGCGSSFQTHLPERQVKLWLDFTRAPRAFTSQGCLVNTLAALEVRRTICLQELALYRRGLKACTCGPLCPLTRTAVC